MNYIVKWGRIPNTQDGKYDIQGVLEQLKICSGDDLTVSCSDWEVVLWNRIRVGDYLEKIVELKEGESIYVPFQNENEMLPDVLIITATNEI